MRLKDAKEVQENQNVELNKFKELFKLLRNSGSEALDEILASGRTSKDHTGIGYYQSSSMKIGEADPNPVFVKSTGLENLNNKEEVEEVQKLQPERKNLTDVTPNVATSGKTSHGERPSAYRKIKQSFVS